MPWDLRLLRQLNKIIHTYIGISATNKIHYRKQLNPAHAIQFTGYFSSPTQHVTNNDMRCYVIVSIETRSCCPCRANRTLMLNYWINSLYPTMWGLRNYWKVRMILPQWIYVITRRRKKPCSIIRGGETTVAPFHPENAENKLSNRFIPAINIGWLFCVRVSIIRAIGFNHVQAHVGFFMGCRTIFTAHYYTTLFVCVCSSFGTACDSNLHRLIPIFQIQF